MKKQTIAIVLGLVCLLLVMSICVQIKTVKSMQGTLKTSWNPNSELIDEVFSWQERYNNVYDKLEEAEKTLEDVRTEASAKNQEDTSAEKELKLNNALLGLTEVTGEGIVITLDDNRNENASDVAASKYLVHEEDLLQVVNELFNAGAEAIAINGQRIVGQSTIICDGNIIRVNGERVTVPIKIEAICSKTIVNTLIRPDGYLQLMADEMVQVKIDDTKSVIKIPKYEGIYSYNYLTRGDE